MHNLVLVYFIKISNNTSQLIILTWESNLSTVIKSLSMVNHFRGAFLCQSKFQQKRNDQLIKFFFMLND